MIALVLALLLGATPAAAQGLTDSLIHLPPTSGACPAGMPYSPPGTCTPGGAFLGLGATYVDPVFGQVIRRLTNVWPNGGDSILYSKNGFWNANGTRLAYSQSDSGTLFAIDTTTGAVIRSGLPGYGPSEVNFDPIDPDIWYWGSGSSLMAFHLSTGTSSTVHTFSGTVGALGGSGDMVDNTGRWFLVNAGGTMVVWDKTLNLIYANQGSISPAGGGGYSTIAPDGSGAESVSGTTVTWYPINATAHTFGPAASRPSVEGDHGDIVCPSDGNCYHIFDHTSTGLVLWRINLTSGGATQVLDLSALTSWDDVHFSCVPRGIWRDWCVVATETNLLNDLGSWSPWHQEIILFNVLTGAVHRLAHHRSREINNYQRSPRVSVNWDGTAVAFSSSFGYEALSGAGNGYSDVYAVTITRALVPPAPPLFLRFVDLSGLGVGGPFFASPIQ